mgnify:CR=1 FL=1|tara:strand:+ start:45159 stop:45677 length:519 start_codon:yes stop_codon:yes gene_type:complete
MNNILSEIDNFTLEEFRELRDYCNRSIDKLKMDSNSTLIIIKPASFAKQDHLKIMDELTKKYGYTLMSGKTMQITLEQAEMHYEEHRGKPWFEKITRQLSSGPLYVAVLGSEHIDTVSRIRKLIGATDPKEADPYTIRARYGTCVDDNVIHASDSSESAHYEKQLWAGFMKE